MQLPNNTLSPYSQLTVDFEEHLGELLAENERLLEHDREQAAYIAQAVHDLRGFVTSLNLTVYLLEHGKSDQQEHYMDNLKASIMEVRLQIDELMTHVRQNTIAND